MKILCGLFIITAILMLILNEPHGFAAFTILAALAGVAIVTDDDTK